MKIESVIIYCPSSFCPTCRKVKMPSVFKSLVIIKLDATTKMVTIMSNDFVLSKQSKWKCQQKYCCQNPHSSLDVKSTYAQRWRLGVVAVIRDPSADKPKPIKDIDFIVCSDAQFITSCWNNR